MKTFFGYDFPEGDDNYRKLFGFGASIVEPKRFSRFSEE